MSNDSETLWLKEKFAKYDADGSGDIDVSELQTLMSEVTGETPTAPEVAGFIEAVDADSDGKLDFEEFVAIFLRARSGDLEFGGLRLAMDAFNDLIADELDGDDDARPPSPTPEPERRSSALGAPEAKRPEKRPPPADGAAPGEEKRGFCACCAAWAACLCGSTMIYSRGALLKALRKGCPCLPPRVIIGIACILLPLLWVWMSLKLLLFPCLAVYLARCLATPKRACYEKLMRCAARLGCMCDLRYHDPFFECVDGPMSGFSDSERNGVDVVVEWKRPQQIFGDAARASLFEGGVSPDDVDQGTLGDCWLLAAFAAAAEFPGTIRRAFLTTEANWRGRYVVTLFDGATGHWIKVVVDDRIPCKAGTNDPIFCKPAGAELWVLLLEKAFAKFVGGYHNLAGGFPIWALRALTGDDAYTLSREKGGEAKPWYRTDMVYKPTDENRRGVGWVHHCGADGDPERFADDELFRMVEQYDAMGFVMSASTSIKDRQDGLVGGHAYSLIAAAEAEGFRLLKLRNPWGNFEWTGAWSDGSELWKTHPKVAKRCGVDPAKPDDDGVFWIEYGDFLKYYDSVDVLKKSEDLHDIYLDTHESWRCCGPCRGLVEGCCCYYAACRGGFKLCCGRETGDETVAAAPKRDCCCPGGKKPARDVEAG